MIGLSYKENERLIPREGEREKNKKDGHSVYGWWAIDLRVALAKI